MSAKPLIYLDYAAATPLDAAVLAAMTPYFSQQFYNPSALYWPAHQVAKDIAAARAKVAGWLGSRPSEVVFTAGGTEANNLAIHGVMARFPAAEMLASSIEHDSVLEPARQYNSREIPVTPEGLVDLPALTNLISDRTVLISVMYANNEIGTIQPIREIAQLVAAVRRQRQAAGNHLPLYLHSDACQAANYLDLHVSRLGVDLMTLNGGKIYGPKQSGVLFVKAGVELEPLVYGGGQENNQRSGTENVPAIIGFAAALDQAQHERQAEAARLQALQKQFIDCLTSRLPEARINGSQKKRLPNNVHVTLPGKDNERLLVQLDEAGILAAAGSACSASSDEPSHVLKAIGLSEVEAQASLRFTLGRSTDAAAIDFTLDTLTRL